MRRHLKANSADKRFYREVKEVRREGLWYQLVLECGHVKVRLRSKGYPISMFKCLVCEGQGLRGEELETSMDCTDCTGNTDGRTPGEESGSNDDGHSQL